MFPSEALAKNFLFGLSILDSYVKLCGKVRLTDIHIVSEQFICELLNIVYGFQLSNANGDNSSTPGYDLISTREQLVIQVSGKCTPEKALQAHNTICSLIEKHDATIAKSEELPQKIAELSKALDDLDKKIHECNETLTDYSGPRSSKDYTNLIQQKADLASKRASCNAKLIESKANLQACKEYIQKKPDLRNYRLIVLFLSLDSSNIRNNQRVKNLAQNDIIRFDAPRDIIDLTTIGNRVTKNILYTEREDRLRAFMNRCSDLFSPNVHEADCVQEVIDEYARNYCSTLFLHKYEDSIVTLKNMYITPSFTILPENSNEAYAHDTPLCGKTDIESRDIINLLCSFLWPNHKNDRERIMFIEGDAAIGKTSLVSWLCYLYQLLPLSTEDQLPTNSKEIETAKAIFLNRKIVCIRLRELDFNESHTADQVILNYLNIQNMRQFQRSYPGAILILDGADELSMVSGSSINSIEEFIFDVRKTFGMHKIIVTTRPKFLNMTQFSSSAFRIRRVILNHYDHGMRLEWLKKYEECNEVIPTNTREYILNISDHSAIGVADTPLALYLLARCDMRKELQGNQWALFHEIFANAIAKAEYNDNFIGSPSSVLGSQISSVNYRVVTNIAYRMFQNSREDRYYINEQEIDEVIQDSDLKSLSREQVRKTCVLCAYWKTSTTLGALEFYHNNIRDFFLCEYICNALKNYVFIDYDHNARTEDLLKKLCDIFRWADIEASTWKETFVFIWLRLKYESIHDRNPDSLYTLVHRAKSIPHILYRLSVSKVLWNHTSKEIPYVSAKNVFSNVLILIRILTEYSADAGDDTPIHFWMTDEEQANWNNMNLMYDWCELLQRVIPISKDHNVSIASRTEYGSVSLSGLAHLYGVDFNHSKFSGTRFDGSTLDKATFTNAVMHDASFIGTHLHEANFTNAAIRNGEWSHCLGNTDFTSANIEGMHVVKEHLISLCFDNATVKNSEFTSCALSELQITGNASFVNVDFSKSEISGNLIKATFSDCNFTNIKLSSTSKLVGLCFQNTAFTKAILCSSVSHAEFKNCDFSSSDFSRTEVLDHVVFENCNLSDCEFRKIRMDHVIFSNCTCFNSNFFQVQFNSCTINGSQTNLTEARFISAKAWNCNFHDADFRKANTHNSIGLID